MDGDLLIVGGEDHKTGQADDAGDRFDRLEAWTRERFPIGPVEFQWSGQVMEPADGLAYIGRAPIDPDHTFVATGDSGHGITHGTIAGILIADLIMGRKNDWEDVYDPSRTSLKAAGEYVRENVNVAKQYVDYVTPGEVSSEADIPAGQGAVCAKASRRSPFIETMPGSSTGCPRYAHTLAVSSTGTRPRRHGTVRAMAHDSGPRAKC